MCSTCNYKEFIPYIKEGFRGTEKRLRNENQNLDINCNETGKDFKIGDFVIYRCPTCGSKLY